MKAGRVPTAVVGPVIAKLIEQEGDSTSALARRIGCDEATIRNVIKQKWVGADFDLVDMLLCKLGAVQLWTTELADVYPERFLETCTVPGCERHVQMTFTNGHCTWHQKQIAHAA